MSTGFMAKICGREIGNAALFVIFLLIAKIQAGNQMRTSAQPPAWLLGPVDRGPLPVVLT